MTHFNPIAGPTPDSGAPDRQLIDAKAATDTFLKLLVAQMRSQNPLEPQTGTEFLTQLAQFNTLEQLIAIRSEIAALRQAAEEP
jgi:flagellar hook assembly protein FlgD